MDDADNDGSGFDHVISGRLLCGGAAVAGEQVVIKVNGTAVCAVETSGDGTFSVTLNLEAVDNKPTSYQVEAVFYGDNALNLTGMATLPNGTKYAVCTTLQYFEYKPASNAAWLTVEPQSTQVGMSEKTPEELQAEAESSGWLRVEPEFSWWYPWYRLHFIGEYDGEPLIDVGVAIFPGADSAFYPYTDFRIGMHEWTEKAMWNILMGIVATETVLWLASHAGPFYFGLALLGYIAYKFGTLWANWNSLEKLWVSLASTFISTAISTWAGLSSFLPSALRTLATSAASAKNVAFAFLCKLIMIPVNIFLLMMTWNRIQALGGV